MGPCRCLKKTKGQEDQNKNVPENEGAAGPVTAWNVCLQHGGEGYNIMKMLSLQLHAAPWYCWVNS